MCGSCDYLRLWSDFFCCLLVSLFFHSLFAAVLRRFRIFVYQLAIVSGQLNRILNIIVTVSYFVINLHLIDSAALEKHMMHGQNRIASLLFTESENTVTALIDMYAKCGRIDNAKQVFDETEKRDLLTWTSLILGLSMHGLGEEALKVFDDMLAEGIKLDNITLIGVLNACSHSGKIKGISIFNNMKQLWGISPKIEHFGCYIDLLSLAGRLEEAFKVIKAMKIKPDDIIWRSLLSACRVQKNVHLAEKITHYVRNTHGGGCLLLSNLHASFGQWDDARQIRESEVHKEDDSTQGCSYIEINGVVHEFLASDKLHPLIKEITCKLNEVMKRISLEGGYVPMTKSVLFDLSEEGKELAISWHSEKLAVAFGFLSSSEGTRIHM